MSVLLIADIVYGFQQTAVTPALPVVEQDLHTNPAWATWLLSGYFIVAAVAPVFLGKLADRSGKRRVFLAALAVFGIGSIVAAAAPSIGVLVIARVIQGAGGVVLPLTFAILRDHATGEQVSRGIGILTGGFGLGSLAGFTLGGLITQELSWRWIFIIGVIALALALLLVRATVPPSPTGPRRGLDAPGAALFGAAVAALILALTLAPQQGWAAPAVIALFVITAAAAVGWAARELHTSEPLMDLRVLASRPVLLTNLVSMVAGYAVVGVNVLVPFLLIGGAHGRVVTFLGLAAGPLLTGIVFIPRGLGQSAGGLITTRLTRRLGAAPTFALGMLAIDAASISLALWRQDAWQLLAELAGIGLGWGIATSTSGSVVTLTAEPGETSIANSINSVLRRVGGVIGTQVAAILLATITLGDGAPAPAAFTIGFAAATGLALAGAAGILFIRTPTSGA
jgi:MFS family permease